MTPNTDKREIQKQWDQDPCGASTATGDAGSLQFYRSARDYRYNEYGPWFDTVVGLNTLRDRNVLEIGVGLGSDHYRLLANGNRVTAVDLSIEHLRHTRRHLSLEGFPARPVRGDAEALPFPDETFDLVYAFGVLHHTPDLKASLREIHRVLKPGGEALIGLYHRNSWFFWVQTFFVNGLLKLGFIRKGWRGVLSEIEFRRNPDSARPLVRVYSRRQVARVFGHFDRVTLRTCHVERSHFSLFGRLLGARSRDQLEEGFSRGGGYVIVSAAK